ncbi:MAG TPA: TRAP transporter large permease subunit, partial [Beijerinckiaceae bacterium]
TRQAAAAAVLDALKGTASIFFVVIGAVLLTRFMALSGVPVFLTDVMGAAGTSQLLVVFLAFAVYLVLGMFLDPLGLLLLTLPIMLPVFEAARIDMVWMGILIVKFVEIGLMTPPVGLNVYAVKTLVGKEASIETIFRGVMWFLIVDIFVTIVLILVPEITLFLPRLMS